MRNLLISSPLLDTSEVAYPDSLIYYREYSLILIDPYLRLIDSSTFASLISLGKNLSKKAVLNNSQVTKNPPKARVSYHILHQDCATSLS